MNTLSRSVPSKDLRDQLADVLGGVAYGAERVGVMRHGKLTAVVIGVDDLEPTPGACGSVTTVCSTRSWTSGCSSPWSASPTAGTSTTSDGISNPQGFPITDR